MAKKGKNKRGKGRGNENSLAEWKKKELQKLWDGFLVQTDEFESRLNNACKSTCMKIQKIYSDKLKSLPENILNMTVSEYMQMQQSNNNEGISNNVTTEGTNNILLPLVEKNKLMSEKKKTLKKNRLEKKRSLSASICSGIKVVPSNPLYPRVSRTLSESCLNTPLSKRSVVPSGIVTPKFNPRVPMNKNLLRKPRVGEIVMSLSGSPLQNVVEDLPDKPGLAVSFGDGKILKITDETEVTHIEQEFLKKLDEETKLTLANVKKKLEKILQN